MPNFHKTWKIYFNTHSFEKQMKKGMYSSMHMNASLYYSFYFFAYGSINQFLKTIPFSKKHTESIPSPGCLDFISVIKKSKKTQCC